MVGSRRDRRQGNVHLKTPFHLLLLALLLAACAVPPSQGPRSTVDNQAAATATERFELDSFQWRGDIAGRELVRATNEWGDLRTRTADRGGLVVSAMIQNIGTTRDEFEIRVDETGDAVAVEVVPQVSEPRGRVDLTLIIPPGKRLQATTRDGLAELKYNGDIAARTRGGDIFIKTAAHASAESETGAISARLSGGRWHDPVSLASGSGDITVGLPGDAGVVLSIDTAGAIDVAFPTEAAQKDSENGRLETRLGAGGPTLRIDSVSGSVRVVPLAHAAR